LIDLPKGVKFIRLNEAIITGLYEKLSKHAKIWEDGTNSYEFFHDHVMRPDVYLFKVGEDIVIELADIIWGVRGRAHAFFLGHKGFVEQRETLRDLIMWGFFQFDLRRIEALVPKRLGAYIRFIRKYLGFRPEGTLRRHSMYDGVPTDMLMLSIIREDFEDGLSEVGD